MNGKYFLHGSLKAKSGHGQQLADILSEAAKIVGTTDACQLYLLSRDKNDPDTIWITEVWKDKQAHERSLTDDNVRALISQAIPILDGTPQRGQELEVIGGSGLAE